MKASDYVDLHAADRPDSEWADDGTQQCTFAEASRATNQVARAILAEGLRPGDHVALITRNRISAVVMLLGAIKSGVVVTPVNCRLPPSQWQEILTDCDAKLIFADAESAAKIDPLCGSLSTGTVLIVAGEAMPGWTPFEDWIAGQLPDEPNASVSEDQDVLQVYTSGTTGRPRGVLLTQRAVVCCLEQLAVVAPFQPSDRFLLVLPLFHAAGIIAMFQALRGGASILIHQRFSPPEVVDAMDRQGVTIAMLTPSMIRACLDETPNIEARNFESLRLIVYGASPMKEQTLSQAMRVFGCEFAQRYGSTETLCLTWLAPRDHQIAIDGRPERLRSAGRPLPGNRIRVVDAQRNVVGTGKRGQFAVSSPALMREYSNDGGDPSFEAEGARWLLTGDCGYVDCDGYVYLCDRATDVIISGGENVYPQDIESVLLAHPDIQDAVVIGVPDAKWGEAVKALVVLRSDAEISTEQLLSYSRNHLAGFQSPRSIETVPSIARDPSGKVSRSGLREPYWKDQPRSI